MDGSGPERSLPTGALTFTLAFSPFDPALLASGGDDRVCKLWDLSTGTFRTLSGHTNWIFALAFSPLDPKLLGTASDDATVKIWDVGTGECVQTLQGHARSLTAIAFSPFDPDWVLSGGNEGNIKLWSIRTGACLRTYEGHTNWVRCLNFSPHQSDVFASAVRPQPFYYVPRARLLQDLISPACVQFWDIVFCECKLCA